MGHSSVRMSIVTLKTDFGPSGRYVAQMKGVLYQQAAGVTVVDLSHDIPPQDVAAAATLLEQAAPYWPRKTVHLAVVDPGVGTERAILAIDALGQRFVGPDNGLFGWLKGRLNRMVTLQPERLKAAGSSHTFHGRDLMAPAAARLTTGADLSELGDPQSDLITLPRPDAPDAFESRVEGVVAEVDHYGNLITNVPIEALEDAPHGDRLHITLGEHETFGLWQTYGEQRPQTLIALVGSGGMVELAIVNGSAAAMLAASVGDAVIMNWAEQ
ncbi:MAG: SAM-dependent chlorinase/fluorinase [Planctomycetota bacterium]